VLGDHHEALGGSGTGSLGDHGVRGAGLVNHLDHETSQELGIAQPGGVERWARGGVRDHNR
jgi:hypothetical protein